MKFEIRDPLFESVVHLEQNELTLGSGNDSAVTLREKGIKKVHAVIRREWGQWVLEPRDKKARILQFGTEVSKVQLSGRQEFEIGHFTLRVERTSDRIIVEIEHPHGLQEKGEFRSGRRRENQVLAEDYNYKDGQLQRRRFKRRLNMALFLPAILFFGGWLIFFPESRLNRYGPARPMPPEINQSAEKDPEVTEESIRRNHPSFYQTHLFADKALAERLRALEKGEGESPVAANNADQKNKKLPEEITPEYLHILHERQDCGLCHQTSDSGATPAQKCAGCHLPVTVMGDVKTPANCLECHFEHRQFDHRPAILNGFALLKEEQGKLPVFYADLQDMMLAEMEREKEQWEKARLAKQHDGENAKKVQPENKPEEKKEPSKTGLSTWQQLKAWLGVLPRTNDPNTPAWVDKSCFDCHENGNLEKNHRNMTEFMSGPRWEVKFPHAIHEELEDLKEGCADCHEKGQMTTRDKTRNNCFDCHKDPTVAGNENEQKDYCFGCHNYHHSTNLTEDNIKAKMPWLPASVLMNRLRPGEVPARKLIEP